MNSQRLPDDVFKAALQAMRYDPGDPEDNSEVHDMDDARKQYSTGLNLTKEGSEYYSSPHATTPTEVTTGIGDTALRILERNAGLERATIERLIAGESETDLSDVSVENVKPINNGDYFIK